MDLIGKSCFATQVRRFQSIKHRQFWGRLGVAHVSVPMLVDIAFLTAVAQLDYIGVIRQPTVGKRN